MKQDSLPEKTNNDKVRYSELLAKEIRLEKLEVENQQLHSLVVEFTGENELFWQLYEFSSEHPVEFEKEHSRLTKIVEESEKNLSSEGVVQFKENVESLRLFTKIHNIKKRIENLDQNTKVLWDTLVDLRSADSDTKEKYHTRNIN